MERQRKVKIPPKRLRLIGILCGSLLYLLIFCPLALNLVRAIALGSDPIPWHYPFFVLLLLSCVVTMPYMFVFALWALVRLVFNLPALILTPEGIVNHSVVYHVILPWDEIEQFTLLKPKPGSTKPRKFGSMNSILVHERDGHRLYDLQQPLTQLALRAFSTLRPINISTAVTAGTQDAVWMRLQTYVRDTMPNRRIKFVRL